MNKRCVGTGIVEGNFFAARVLGSVWNKVFASALKSLAAMTKKISSGKDWHKNFRWQYTEVNSPNSTPHTHAHTEE